MKKHIEAINHHLRNPNDSADTIAKKLKTSKQYVCEIIGKHYDEKRRLYVAASLSKDNTFFAFNGINEREFHTDNNNFILDSSGFSAMEKQALRSLGFKCYND